MTEREQQQGGDVPQRETTSRAGAGADGARALFVFRAGGQEFAVFAEEVEAAGENLRPAPLPFAPPAVVGVVAVRGRMRTVLDPVRLLDPPAPTESEARPTPPEPEARAALAAAAPPEPTAATTTPPRLFVALAGDEQLALACDSAEGPVNVRLAQLASAAADSHAPVRARLEHEGRTITLLDASRLFDAAMRGTDRRRRRS